MASGPSENQPLECYCCGGVYPRRELIAVEEIPGYRWPRYCRGCAEEIRAAHNRQCLLCGGAYLARWPGDVAGLCPACHSDEHLHELARVRQHLARAQSLNLPATLTLRQWLSAIAYFGGLCAYCQSRPYSDLDHVIPLAAGGGTTAANCVPACGRCNSAKGSNQLQVWAWPHGPALERLQTYLHAFAP
jgi:5-methylcytosine-specific restriction endonuclease McrA